MTILPLLIRLVPRPLRRPLRKCSQFILRGPRSYQTRFKNELEAFANPDDIPPILTYWAEKYLTPVFSPFGFINSIECFRAYLARVCRAAPGRMCSFASIGAGACTTEINIAEWLRENGIANYSFECIDINSAMLSRGRACAEEKGLSHQFVFSTGDVNQWRPRRQYDAILAFQYLHHVVELESLLATVRQALRDDGYFLTDDMIGRNGHQRWPEALKHVQELWSELPGKYKYNHKLKRLDNEYDNWDCSTEGFEGIRSQDILPLLVERFHFDLFIAFGNIIDIFVDRCYGPNFDPANEWDRAFIDRVHALDVAEIEAGRVKPTHILAVMKRVPVPQTLMHKHLSPEFCIRQTARTPL